ncbi:MAG: hypothetical protein V7664_00900 [Qipengyuania sp.]
MTTLSQKPISRGLRDPLEGIEGRLIISINATPMIREMFAGFTIEDIRVN